MYCYTFPRKKIVCFCVINGFVFFIIGIKIIVLNILITVLIFENVVNLERFVSNNLNKVKFAPEFKFGTKPVKCLAIEYPDGRKYYGVLKAKEGFRSITDFFTKIKTSSGLPSQESYQDGVLTYPDGRQEIFVKGNTLSQLQEYSQQKEDELAEKIEQVNLRLIHFQLKLSFSNSFQVLQSKFPMCLQLQKKRKPTIFS